MPMRALLRLEPSLVRSRMPEIKAFESESSEPGKGLGMQVAYKPPPDPTINAVYEGTVCTVTFGRLLRCSYLQFAVRIPALEWVSIGAISPPTDPFVMLSQQERDEIHKGISVKSLAFSVDISKAGEMAFSRTTPDHAVKTQRKLLSWAPESNQWRLVARLKCGSRIIMPPNAWSPEGDLSYQFCLNPLSEPVFVERMMNYSPEYPNGFETIAMVINLRDVEAFEVETRKYAEPVYFVAKVPQVK